MDLEKRSAMVELNIIIRIGFTVLIPSALQSVLFCSLGIWWKIMIEKVLNVAMRGRWIDNKWCQQLEINNEKYSNTITTAQKDTLILVKEDDGIIEWQK